MKGRWAIFCPTRNKRIYDNKGNKVFVVRTKFWKFWTQKAFIKDCATRERLATVKYGIWTTNGRYVVEGHRDEIEIVGKRWSLEREVLRNGENMAKVTSNFMSFMDNYIIDADDADSYSFDVFLAQIRIGEFHSLDVFQNGLLLTVPDILQWRG